MTLKNYRIKESIGDIETHEIFLDDLAHQKEEELGLSEKKFEVKISETFMYAIFTVFFLTSVLLFVKTAYLQTVHGQYLRSVAQSNKGKITLVRADRGIMYDKNYKKLVSNAPAYDLLCDKKGFADAPGVISQETSFLADILKKPSGELAVLFAEADEAQVLVAENLHQEDLLVVEARLAEISDCHIEKNTVRNYAYGSVFSHVLGYNGKITKTELQQTDNYTLSDYIGKSGLEKQYETALRGTPGQQELIRTASGVQKGQAMVQDPKQGYNLVLNVDADLQKTTYEALEKSIKNISAKRGAAIALDPRTGAVLALVSYPAYDNNIFSESISKKDFDALNSDPNQPFFDRAISAQYPTGSTIKPFLATGALQEQLISPNKLINDPGYIIVKSQNDPTVEYKFAGVIPHGLVDMRKAIAVSSNIYFYTVGGGFGDQKGLGPARIKKYLDMYGWEQKTGIDLPGEFKGFVPSPIWKKETKKENWWDGDTYNLSIGQSDLQVTPIQVAVAYGAIANGGTLYKPQIVQKIIDGSGQNANVVQEFTPQVNGTVSIDPQYLQIVREGMLDGVLKEYGSSHMLNDLPVQVAGKTGTAETNKAGVYNTWSVNFAPYSNPEIIFLATIEGVQGLRSATLPVAHDVLQYYFQSDKE